MAFANPMAVAGGHIRRAQRIVVISHERPDPDTVGSSLGLAALLRAMGKDVTVLVPETNNDSLQQISGWQTVEWDPVRQRRAVAGADLVIAIDNTELSRFGNLDWVIPAARAAVVPTINIDHHKSNRYFADVNIVDPTAAACAQVVYDLAVAQGWQLNQDAAESLFAALRSDTGGFQYPGDYGRTFKFAAALAEAGADVSAISLGQMHLPENQMRLLGEVFAATQIDNATGYAKVTITEAMMQRAGVTSDDAYLAIANLGRLQSYRLLAVLIELSPTRTRLSLRTRGVDADAIARSLGGGGHPAAAGATINTNSRIAARKVDAAVRVALGLGPSSNQLG